MECTSTMYAWSRFTCSCHCRSQHLVFFSASFFSSGHSLLRSLNCLNFTTYHDFGACCWISYAYRKKPFGLHVRITKLAPSLCDFESLQNGETYLRKAMRHVHVMLSCIVNRKLKTAIHFIVANKPRDHSNSYCRAISTVLIPLGKVFSNG